MANHIIRNASVAWYVARVWMVSHSPSMPPIKIIVLKISISKSFQYIPMMANQLDLNIHFIHETHFYWQEIRSTLLCMQVTNNARARRGWNRTSGRTGQKFSCRVLQMWGKMIWDYNIFFSLLRYAVPILNNLFSRNHTMLRIAICCCQVKPKVVDVIHLMIIYCARHAMRNVSKCWLVGWPPNCKSAHKMTPNVFCILNQHENLNNFYLPSTFEEN